MNIIWSSFINDIGFGYMKFLDIYFKITEDVDFVNILLTYLKQEGLYYESKELYGNDFQLIDNYDYKL